MSSIEEMAEETPIVNPDEVAWKDTLFKMWAGAYGEAVGYVWADHFEDAFEEFVEWLDDNAPGHLVSLDEDDLKEAARDLGLKWRGEWPDWEDEDFQRVVEHAEVDLTVIGHTTLEHGQYIASWEWGGAEVPENTEEYRIVRERSEEDDADDDDEDELQANPPSWVADEETWERAKEEVEPDWDRYDDPWAVVTHVYKQMGGEVR